MRLCEARTAGARRGAPAYKCENRRGDPPGRPYPMHSRYVLRI
jgi:hypothetical protein